MPVRMYYVFFIRYTLIMSKTPVIVHPEESFYLQTPLCIMSMECRQLRLTKEQDADDSSSRGKFLLAHTLMYHEYGM